MSVTQAKKAAKAARSRALKSQLKASIAEDRPKRKPTTRSGWIMAKAYDPEDVGDGSQVVLEGVAVNVLHTWIERCKHQYVPTMVGALSVLVALGEATRSPKMMGQPEMTEAIRWLHSVLDKNRLDLEIAITSCDSALMRKVGAR